MKQLIIDIDSNHTIVVRHSGGFRQTFKTVRTALKRAAQHVVGYAEEYDANPIVITAEAAVILATE